MNKRTALLLCGTAALMTLNAAAAQPAAAEPDQSVPAARAYADLLAPIPNALAFLRAEDAAQPRQPRARVQLAQYHYHYHHHHHHHHGFFGFGFGGPYVAPYYAGPRDCHWAWGRAYWNGYRWIRRRFWVCD